MKSTILTTTLPALSHIYLPVEQNRWKIESVFCVVGDPLHLHGPPHLQECDQEQQEERDQGYRTAGQKC